MTDGNIGIYLSMLCQAAVSYGVHCQNIRTERNRLEWVSKNIHSLWVSTIYLSYFYNFYFILSLQQFSIDLNYNLIIIIIIIIKKTFEVDWLVRNITGWVSRLLRHSKCSENDEIERDIYVYKASRSQYWDTPRFWQWVKMSTVSV